MQAVIDPISGYSWPLSAHPVTAALMVFNADNMWLSMNHRGQPTTAPLQPSSIGTALTFDVCSSDDWHSVFPELRHDVKVWAQASAAVDLGILHAWYGAHWRTDGNERSTLVS